MRQNWNCPRVLYRLILCAVLIWLPASLWAQGTGGRGSISGTVTDPSGSLDRGFRYGAQHQHRPEHHRDHQWVGNLRDPLLPTGT